MLQTCLSSEEYFSHGIAYDTWQLLRATGMSFLVCSVKLLVPMVSFQLARVELPCINVI